MGSSWLVVDFHPSEKYYIVKLEIFPNFRGENQKYPKPPPSKVGEFHQLTVKNIKTCKKHEETVRARRMKQDLAGWHELRQVPSNFMVNLVVWYSGWYPEVTIPFFIS